MARYFITLQYDGTAYHGWQIQPNAITVEETVENALATLLRQPVDIVGAGRTDTGVHARQMVAHFDWLSDLPMQTGQLVYKLNKILPHSIAIMKIEQVADDMHARFSAKARTYHYYIHSQKDAFLNQHSHFITYNLDYEKMNQGADIMKQYKDFESFCKSNSDVKTTLCEIYDAKWHLTSDSTAYFSITANRFLRNMVRAIVGTLIDVGRGKIELDELRRIIENKNRSTAGDSMPAKALFLENIEY